MRSTLFFLTLILSPVPATIAGPTEDALKLGIEAEKKKEYDSAVQTWVNAYNERATAKTATDETCAKLLENAGRVMAERSNHTAAANCFQMLLALRAALNGERSPEAAVVMARLAAQTANADGDLDKAEQMARDAESILTRAGDAFFDDRIEVKLAVGGILMRKKERLAAHQQFMDLVKLCEEHPTKRFDIPATAYHQMGAIAEFFGRMKDRTTYLKRAAELTEKSSGRNTAPSFLTKLNLADAYRAAGMNKEARDMYASVSQAIGNVPGVENDKTLQQQWTLADYRLAYVESDLQNPERVYELVQSALRHAIIGWGETHNETLAIYLDAAKLHLTKKNYTEGVKCYQRVLDIRRRELGPDHVDTKETQQTLNAVLAEVKRLSAAKKGE